MKKFNIIVGIILLIASIMTALAWYFSVLPNTAMIVTGIIAAIVVLIVALQHFYHHDWREYNPGLFWSVWSGILAAIAVITIYFCGFKVLDQQLAGAIITGGAFSVTPILGVFFGNFAKLIQELRYSAI